MDNLTVYGFGNRGRDVIDQLLALGRPISMIVDQEPSAAEYRGIRVRPISDTTAQECLRGSLCVIALHNSYVDIIEIDRQLRRLGAKPVSLVNAEEYGFQLSIGNGYWLDRSARGYLISAEDETWMMERLADPKSKAIFQGLKRYRETGIIANCPAASTTDEYTPSDLPSIQGPVHLVDCGAYNGITYRKFACSHQVERYLAFEPDPDNFANLVGSDFGTTQVVLLPLGVWERTAALRFNSGGGMGSSIDRAGQSVVQCVAVDDVAPTFDATVIKLDVEGAEQAALLGMKNMITRCRPRLCISVYHRPEDLTVIPRMISGWDLGYSLYLRTHEHNSFGTVLYAIP